MPLHLVTQFASPIDSSPWENILLFNILLFDPEGEKFGERNVEDRAEGNWGNVFSPSFFLAFLRSILSAPLSVKRKRAHDTLSEEPGNPLVPSGVRRQSRSRQKLFDILYIYPRIYIHMYVWERVEQRVCIYRRRFTRGSTIFGITVYWARLWSLCTCIFMCLCVCTLHRVYGPGYGVYKFLAQIHLPLLVQSRNNIRRVIWHKTMPVHWGTFCPRD